MSPLGRYILANAWSTKTDGLETELLRGQLEELGFSPWEQAILSEGWLLTTNGFLTSPGLYRR